MKIIVYPERLQELSREFDNCAHRLGSIENTLRQAVAGLDWETRRKANIEGNLRSLQSLSSGLRTDSHDISRFLSTKAQGFLDADRQGYAGIPNSYYQRHFPWWVFAPIAPEILRILGSDGYQRLHHLLCGEFAKKGEIGINAIDVIKGIKTIADLNRYFSGEGKDLITILELSRVIQGKEAAKGMGEIFAKLDVSKSLKSTAGWVLTGVTAALDVGARWGKDFKQYKDDPSKLAIAGSVSFVETAIVTGASVAGGIAGAKLGAAAGAAIGSLICPGAGTFVGGVVGGFVGRTVGSWLASEGAELIVDKLIEPNKAKIVNAVDDVWHHTRKQAGEVAEFYKQEAQEHLRFWDKQISESSEFFRKKIAEVF